MTVNEKKKSVKWTKRPPCCKNCLNFYFIVENGTKKKQKCNLHKFATKPLCWCDDYLGKYFNV